jgi:hypothetical protein
LRIDEVVEEADPHGRNLLAFSGIPTRKRGVDRSNGGIPGSREVPTVDSCRL